jgi:hypothetical protein
MTPLLLSYLIKIDILILKSDELNKDSLDALLERMNKIWDNMSESDKELADEYIKHLIDKGIA